MLNLNSAAKLIRELVIVLPGPLEAVIGIKKKSINMPVEELPHSYARILCVLKNSDKEFMSNSCAIDSFQLLSMLHFVLGERVRSRRDIQFLTQAYREVFQYRKIASMLQLHNKKVAMCRLYAELVDLRPLLIEIDFNCLRNCLDGTLKEYAKYETKVP